MSTTQEHMADRHTFAPPKAHSLLGWTMRCTRFKAALSILMAIVSII